jgi:hypothetical protein
MVHTCNPGYSGAELGGSRSDAGQSKSMRIYLKNKIKQKGLGVLLKHRTLSSISSTTNNY